MTNVLFDAALSVWLLVSAPGQYTATTPAGDALAFSPARGWVSATECAAGCRADGQERWLLRGEFGVGTLAGLDVTIRRDGVPIMRCYKFFGATPVCE